MDEALTRLAFRVQGGDRDAARSLLVEARTRQHGAPFERAAKALSGGPEILTLLEANVSEAVKASFRELVPTPAEAAASFTPAPIDLDIVTALGPDALVLMARWAIEALHLLPRYGSGLPYLGAAIAIPWAHVERAFASRVEAPWLAVRVIAALDATKKPLAEAMVTSFFAVMGERAANAAHTVLGHESPPARRLLWTKLVVDHEAKIDDASMCALLDDPPTRELALRVLLARGQRVSRHVLPYLHATAPGTRRAVAGLLAVLGDADAVPFLRQAIAGERDARTRVQLAAALEKISGAEPLVPEARGEDAVLARARAALATPRPPKPPPWLATIGAELTGMRFRHGETALTRSEIDVLVGRLALLRAGHADAAMADVRAALHPESARRLIAAIRAAFSAVRERHVFPDWMLRAMAVLLSEADLDRVCEEIDANLRTPARERWKRGPVSPIELVWDPDPLVSSPCRVAFAWLVHWAESAPTRRDREKAQRALIAASRAIPESERPFVCIRRYGLDDDGTRRFEETTSEGVTELVVRVRTGGAIDVTNAAGEPVSRLPGDELGRRVKLHVDAVEEALLEARRTLAEAYADRLVVDARFVRELLLAHPLWRPIVQGCVVRREAAAEPRSAAVDQLGSLSAEERVRFVLSQVEP
ncbi:MAG: hypothetical protein JST00_47360 [Deltaproteobacteria bacterium]|nr:hypothetical protein [Deltaproteobacteria bacterium]